LEEYYPLAVDFYKDRHKHKQLFFDICNAFRDIDPLFVPGRLVSVGADLVTGIRSCKELQAFIPYCKKVIWLERPECLTDTTLEFCRDDAEELAYGKFHIVFNNGQLDSLYLDLCELFSHDLVFGPLNECDFLDGVHSVFQDAW
jgi:hypothetical protein